MKRLLFAFCIIAMLSSPSTILAQSNPSLHFVTAPDIERSFTLDQLKAELPVEQIELFDTQHGKQKNYLGFALADVLRLGFGDEWQSDHYTEMVFTALDGYAAVTALDKLNQPGGYIVFEDLDVGGWELIGHKQANPGPYYLVWTGAGQTTQNQYPWPWQIGRIELMRFEDRYPRVYPLGVDASSDVFKGFLTYKGRCLRCHAIDQQGGKLGPDLNAPQSVTEYRSPAMLKAFIRQPSQFRYSQMPDHLDLDEAQIEQILEYLRHQTVTRK